VHAHPDDETIYMGGTLARYAAAGIRIVCATGTRGELGEIVDPSLATSANFERLGKIRMDEMARALGRLGPIEARWLGYRDSGMEEGHEGDPGAFCHASADEVAGRVARLIREIRPQVVITLDEARAGDHRDHVHAAVAARLAFEGAGLASCWPEQLEGPEAVEVWQPAKLYAANGHSWRPLGARRKVKLLLREHGPIATMRMLTEAVLRRVRGRRSVHEPIEAVAAPPERLPATTQIDVAAWVARRYAAVREYRTQIPRDDPLIRIPAKELARLSPTEDFRLLAGPTSGIPEQDIFAAVD
jgi:N-acetyl-1-D-myo-inositol-2-amino-2-deoxy-alpha-D-glucopyranoside deacetylase